jgi:hypothetical protein
MDKTKLIFNAMINLVKNSKKRGADDFKWDKDDRIRLVRLIIRSNESLDGPCLLDFLTQCDMMTHEMLSSLLISNKLKFKEILIHISNISTTPDKLKLFLEFIEDSDSYQLADNSHKDLKQVLFVLY